MMHGRSSWAAVISLIGAAVAISRPAAGFNVSSNLVLEGGVLAGDGAGNSITPTAVGGGYLYDWTGVATPGLDMGAYLMTNGNGSNLVFNLAGGAIAGSNATLITTYRGSIAGWNSASVTISNAPVVAAGGVRTSASRPGAGFPGSNAGTVKIGTVSHPAGPVRVGFIDAHTGYANGGNGVGGSVFIYSTGDVGIETQTGQMGDVTTWGWSQYAGAIMVVHEGAFRANDLLTYLLSHWTGGTMRSGNITCDGDRGGDGPSGAFEVNNVRAYYAGTGYGSRGGDVLVRGYRSVLIKGAVQTYEASNQSWLPGHVTISNITGEITIQGDVDLSGYLNAGGNLQLSADGVIKVGGLDLNKMNKAAFNSARGKSYILGTLTNFTGTHDPRLLTPAGHKVYYNADFNASLAGAIFPLRDLGGLIGGGTLEPIPARGTVVVFR